MIRYDKHKRKDGIKTQVRVVEGYRVNGRIKQKTIKDFGYLEDQENKDEFVAIVKKFDEDYKKGKLLLKKNTRKKFFEDNNSVKYNYGYKFLSAIYDSLKLEEFFSNVDFKGDYDLNSILKYFAIQRILNPSSKRHTTQIMKNLYENNIDFELADVYRSLDKFSDLNTDIQKYINERIVKLIGRKFDYGFYDVTNYYCEVDFPDENGGLRQRGVSKEHRTDPIIQFGLFIDENSLPVCMSIFPGNTSDSLTFQPTMNKIKENYSLKKIIAVADKGMNSSKNIDYLVNSGNGFVFSQILKGKKGIIFGALNDMSIAWKVAEKAVEEGATITLSNTPIAVRMGQVDELAKKLNAQVIPADATSVEDLQNVFSKSVEILGGPVDFVLHSIGMSPNVRKKRTYDDLDYNMLQKTLDISAISFHKMLQVAKKQDAIAEYGSVVALTYVAAQRTFFGYNDMADAKSLLESIARSFGYIYGREKNVRINTISQSPTPTTAGNGVKGMEHLMDFANKMSPLGNANAEECANYCVMMFSDFTRKVTMQNLYHDGGFSSMGMSLRAMNQYSKGFEEYTDENGHIIYG